MARAPLPPTSAAAPVEPPVDPRKQAVEALMRLAATHPWDEIELGDIAAEAGLPVDRQRIFGWLSTSIAARGNDRHCYGLPNAHDAGNPAQERLLLTQV